MRFRKRIAGKLKLDSFCFLPFMYTPHEHFLSCGGQCKLNGHVFCTKNKGDQKSLVNDQQHTWRLQRDIKYRYNKLSLFRQGSNMNNRLVSISLGPA